MSSTRFVSNPRCFCPACGRYVYLDRAPVPAGPPGVVMPEAMFSGLCQCGAGISLAVSMLTKPGGVA